MVNVFTPPVCNGVVTTLRGGINSLPAPGAGVGKGGQRQMDRSHNLGKIQAVGVGGHLNE